MEPLPGVWFLTTQWSLVWSEAIVDAAHLHAAHLCGPNDFLTA